MDALAIMKRLVDIGLPSKWLVPVMEAIDNPESGPTRRKKRRKRRTKAQIARDQAASKKTTRKKRAVAV